MRVFPSNLYYGTSSVYLFPYTKALQLRANLWRKRVWCMLYMVHFLSVCSNCRFKTGSKNLNQPGENSVVKIRRLSDSLLYPFVSTHLDSMIQIRSQFMIVNSVKSFFNCETKNNKRRECCVSSSNVTRKHGSTFTNSDGNETVPQSPFPRTNGDNKNSTNTEQVWPFS